MILDIPQMTSSPPSVQSLCPLQTAFLSIQSPLAHENCTGEHVAEIKCDLLKRLNPTYFGLMIVQGKYG